MSPNNAPFAKIDQLIALGRHAEAEPLIRAYITDHGDDPTGYANLAMSLAGQNRIPEAAEAADRAVAIGPDDPLALYIRAALLLDVGKHDECVTQCTEALARVPGKPGFLLLRGQAYQNQAKGWDKIKIAKRNDEKGRASNKPMYLALNDLEAALQMLPEDPEPHKAMAGFALRNEWPSEAARYSRGALSLDPNDATAHLLLGAAQEQLGKFGPASESYVAAGRADVRSDASIKQLRRLGRPTAVIGTLSIWAISRMVRAGLIAGRYGGLLIGALVVVAVLAGTGIWFTYKKREARASMSPEVKAILERDQALRGSAASRLKGRFGR